MQRHALLLQLMTTGTTNGAVPRKPLASCRRALLDDVTNIALSSGAAFVIGADKQFNAAVVVSRGLELSGSYQSGMAELALAADTIGRKASFCFEAGERASRGLLLV